MSALSLSLAVMTLVAGAAPAAEPWKSTPLPPPMPAPAGQGTVDVDGAKLSYATYGAGSPVFLLHGGAGNAEHWAAQIPALADRYQVIVLDARGHGRSTRDDRPFTYHQMAEDLVAVMDRLGLPTASVVGWSDGGIVGLDLAIHHPERVTRLVAFGSNYDLSGMKSGGGPHATFKTYFDRCSVDYQRLSPTPKRFADFNEALKKMWRAQPDFKPADLAKITAATLILDGDHDEIIRQEHLRAMEKLVRGSRVALLKDASHFALWQKPAEFNQVVRDFLDGK